MTERLFTLFEERFRKPHELVAGQPQSLETISAREDEQEFVLRKIKNFEEVEYKVDYSDFSKFVFFNSALDYFNITGEKILNEYPYDGRVDEIEDFFSDLDPYQRHVVESWPARTGHLRFVPGSAFTRFVVKDVGSVGGVTRTALLSPGTGSFSLEFWCEPPPALTGSDDVMVLAQKITGSGDGYTVYFSGSNVHFKIVSGSSTDEVATLLGSSKVYVACVFDRGRASATIYTGSSTSFPVAAASVSSLSIVDRLDVGSTDFTVGSGSLATKIVRPLTGSLDELRVWSRSRALDELSSSFNSKIFAQNGLTALWSCNESGSSVDQNQNSVVLDRSGHRLHGTISGYGSFVRGSGSLLPFDEPDLILGFDAAEVQNFIAEAQASGSTYDRTNDNLITRFLPDQFFRLEEDRGTSVLKNFLFVVAREFDLIKVTIDQFVKIARANYGDFDQAPDALLAEAGRFFGWEFVGSFLNADAFQYLSGRGVLADLETNRELEKKLFEIKNEFWRRTLNNLMYVYKTKGTRESIEALMRVYGVDKGFARLKEHGIKPNVGVATNRILTEKSVPALTFGSGSLTSSNYVLSTTFSSSLRTIETYVRFPTTASSGMHATIPSGNIWLAKSPDGSTRYQLYWIKNSTSSTTGSFFFDSIGENVSLSIADVPLFDDKWYHFAVVKNFPSASFSLQIRNVDRGEIVYSTASTVVNDPGWVLSDFTNATNLWVGMSSSTGITRFTQMWAQEVRVWDVPLIEKELDDHALNFQSYGTERIGESDDLALHWRLNEDETATTDESFALTFPFAFSIEELFDVVDVSTRGNHGFAFGYPVGDAPYRRFLREYSFIAPPDYGWNEDKIRVVPSPKLPPGDTFVENKNVSLEFNMVDALNEDISQIVSSLDEFDEAIGLPANRYRGTYQKLDRLRSLYFKRLQGRLNFNLFADMLEFFDRSFLTMVRRLLPVRANFLGDELVVESHMLERPKVQWTYRRQQLPLELEGRIKVYLRD